MAIDNRYEFLFFIQCVYGNPNGDPNTGNAPRIDPETLHGYMTAVSVKRRIRNYIQLAFPDKPGMDIIMQQGTTINKFIALAREEADSEPSSCAKTSNPVYAARHWCCRHFFDVRTFGAVLTTGPNAGQVRGPVQISYAQSVDPISPQRISITRASVADGPDKAASYAEYEAWEQTQPENKLRTMGQQQFIPFGLYEVHGFISSNLAQETGFDEADFAALREAILNMYEHDRSSSKGEMSVVSPLILFKHVGTDTDPEQRARQARLGCAPAQTLFHLVHVEHKAGINFARDSKDYTATIDLAHIPRGVQVGFQRDPMGEITWDHLPDGEDWLTEK